MGLGHDLAVAFTFLTRLPIRSASWKDGDLAGSVTMFPLVGLVLGLLGTAIYAVSHALGLPSFLAASITIAVLILVTGALHEDGLADIADGFGGGRNKEDRLQIMRDSRIGSFGTLALVLSLILRIGSLAALASPWSVGGALIATGALSRSSMPIAMTFMGQARQDGLATMAGRPHPGRSLAAVLLAIAVTCLCLPWPHAFIVIIISALGMSLLLLLAQRQIGGITGDVIGALQQTSETLGLLTLVALSHDRVVF